MKLRIIALAGASLLALVTPAASNDGWYLGLGAGRVMAGYSDPTETNRKGKTAFAYQAIAGVIWSIAPQVDLQLDYRYVSAAKTTHAFNSPPTKAAGTVQYGDANSHNIMLN